MTDVDLDRVLHGLGGGAAVAAGLALVRLLLDFFVRRADRSSDQAERRRGQQRDAESRLERVLMDRLAQADRRLERCVADMEQARAQQAAIERDYALLEQAHSLLREQYALLTRERVQSEPR
jgi:hypothetical protein